MAILTCLSFLRHLQEQVSLAVGVEEQVSLLKGTSDSQFSTCAQRACDLSTRSGFVKHIVSYCSVGVSFIPVLVGKSSV